MKVKGSELLFFIGVYVLLIRMFCITTTIIELTSIQQNIMLIISSVCLITKILLENEPVNKLFKYFIILIVTFINYRINLESSIFITFLVIIASKNIEIKKIIKNLFLFSVFTITMLIIFYIITYIFNVETLKFMIRKSGDVVKVRYTFFYNHANVFASHICWVYFMYMYLRYDKLSWASYLNLILLAIFIYIFPNSRTTAIIMLSILLIKYVFDHFSKNKIVTFVEKNIWIICMIISIILLIFYSDSSFVQKLNGLFTGRISLGYTTYKLFGIKLLGQQLPLGEAIELSQFDWIMSYALDNWYYRLIFSYGIIITLMYAYFFIKMTRKQFICKNYKNLVFITMLCIFGLCETMPANILMAFPLILMRDEI